MQMRHSHTQSFASLHLAPIPASQWNIYMYHTSQQDIGAIRPHYIRPLTSTATCWACSVFCGIWRGLFA